MRNKMRRIKCTIAYDGTNFAGFQRQPNERTVQGEIEQALKILHKGKNVPICGSGRTDATVHAYGQVFHFDTDLSIPDDRFPYALRSHLPKDIHIVKMETVSSDFHARFSAVRKEYRYRILLRQEADVFRRNFTYHYPYRLNIEEMKKAANLLLGTHDFTSFSSAKTDVVDKVRTIEQIDFLLQDDELVIRIIGNGFLRNMVRIIVGTLLEVGRGHIRPEEIPAILEAKSRQKAGPTIPGCGLYLWKVEYNNET